MNGPIKRLICLGVLAAISSHAAGQESLGSGGKGWKLSANTSRIGTPIRRQARDLFDLGLRVTPEQLRLMAQMDAVEIKLDVKELSAAEIIAAIRDRLTDTPASEIVIRADPSLASLDGRFTYAQTQIRLSDALWLLRMGGTVRYELRSNEIVVIPIGEKK